MKNTPKTQKCWTERGQANEITTSRARTPPSQVRDAWLGYAANVRVRTKSRHHVYHNLSTSTHRKGVSTGTHSVGFRSECAAWFSETLHALMCGNNKKSPMQSAEGIITQKRNLVGVQRISYWPYSRDPIGPTAKTCWHTAAYCV